MFRILMPAIVAFTTVVSSGEVQSQTGQERFEKLYSEIVNAEYDQLELYDKQLDQLEETKSELTLDQKLMLRGMLCHQLRESDDTELAIRVAKKLLAHKAFESELVSPNASGQWREAAQLLFESSQATQRRKFLEELKEKIADSKQSTWLRLAQLSTLVQQSQDLRIPGQARALVEKHLPTLLNEIPEHPPHTGLYILWRLDSALGRARVSSSLRLNALEIGSAKSEAAMRGKEDFDLSHFSNLWRFRLSIARIQSQLSNTSNVLSSLDRMDELFEIQSIQLRKRYSDSETKFEEFEKRSRDFHDKNIANVKQLATDGEIPGTNSLLGKTAPQIDLSFTDGTKIPWKDLQGKIVVLDFWAVWCGPCIASFPDLRDLHEKYAGENVVVIGVTRRHGYRWNPDKNKIEERSQATEEEEVFAITKFLEGHKIGFFQLLDDGSTVDAYKVSQWPTTVVIDKDGVVKFTGSIGKRTGFERLCKTIEELKSK